MKKHLENDFATFRLEKRILHISYREKVTINLSGAMEVVAQRLVLQQGKAYPILCNIREVKDIAGDACRYLAMEGTVLVKALALVYRAPLSKMFTKLYSNDFPPIRIEMYTEETSALEFLSPFANK